MDIAFIKTMIDFPKNCEWLLNKRIERGKTTYEFEIWQGDPTKPIAKFETKTSKQMANRIKVLVKRLNRKKGE